MLQAGVVKPYPYQDVFGGEILDLPKAQIGVPEL